MTKKPTKKEGSLDIRYESILGDIANVIDAARRSAARSVNCIMTAAYWLIGRRIVETEQRGEKRAAYGEELLARLSADLNKRYGRGFGVDNLQRFRAFYLVYPPEVIYATLSRKSPEEDRSLKYATPSRTSQPQKEDKPNGSICQTPSGVLQASSVELSLADIARCFPLSWSAYVRLLGIKNELARKFYETEAQDMISRKTAPYKIDPGWVAVVEVLKRIEEEPFHWPVGRTTFQKIAYFASECGIPTGLKYQRGSYGPYAPALKERITALVNNGLVREEQLGRMFAIRVGPTFPDARKAYEQQIKEWELIIDKIADLFMRLNTKQAEVAATVHFAAREAKDRTEGKPTEKEVLDTVMKWKQKRKPPLDEKEVAITVRNLNMLNWIGAKVSDELPITEEDILHV